MPKLSIIMGKHGISTYKICKLMGLGLGSNTRMKKVINGQATMSVEDFDKLRNELKHIIDDEITYDVVRVRL